MAEPQRRKERPHPRDEAVIDSPVEEGNKGKNPENGHAVHSPTTASGAPVEEQVRKEWDPRKVGLPTF